MSDVIAFLATRMDEDEYLLEAWPSGRHAREVAAKRRMMGRHHATADGMCDWCSIGEIGSGRQVEIGDCLELCGLAAIYSDHPDYRQEWKP